MKNKTKAKLALLLVIAAFFTPACGASSGEEPKAGGQGQSGYTVGILISGDEADAEECKAGFMEGLDALDYTEGVNTDFLILDSTNNEEVAEELAETIVEERVDLFYGIGDLAAQAEYKALYGKIIPGVYAAVEDPYESGFAYADRRPTINLTGVTDSLTPDLQLRMIHDILPYTKMVGIFYKEKEVKKEKDEEDEEVTILESYQTAAKNYGITIVPFFVEDPAKMADTVTEKAGEVGCFLNVTNDIPKEAVEAEAKAALSVKIPLFGADESQLACGIFAAQSPDYHAIGHQAGDMAARMLLLEMDSTTEMYRDAARTTYRFNPKVAESLEIMVAEEYPDRDVAEYKAPQE